MQNNTTHQLTINRPSQLTRGRQVSLFLAVANRYGWSFPILGKAPMPKIPIRLEKWLILPATIGYQSVASERLSQGRNPVPGRRQAEGLRYRT